MRCSDCRKYDGGHCVSFEAPVDLDEFCSRYEANAMKAIADGYKRYSESLKI